MKKENDNMIVKGYNLMIIYMIFWLDHKKVYGLFAEALVEEVICSDEVK